MRKRLLFLFIIAILLFGMISCAPNTVQHNINEYILELNYKENFKVLQLTDIHLSNKDNRQLQYDFLDLTIKDANADLIVVSGDIFTFADKTTAIDFFDFLDSYNTPWTVTFGNHDEQCYFSIDWLTDKLNNYGSNCFFKDIKNDAVFGYSNFAINLIKDDTVFYQIILMDSNRYNYNFDYSGYDHIKSDQIEWYEQLINHTTKTNNEIVPSMLMFHIPIPEFTDAWNAAQNGDAILEYGSIGEDPSVPKHNSGFFDKILELNSTKAIIVGHDHINNFRILYKGVYFCYGVTSTDRIYYNEDLLGGHIITIHPDKTLEFEQIFHKYSEVTK